MKLVRYRKLAFGRAIRSRAASRVIQSGQTEMPKLSYCQDAALFEPGSVFRKFILIED